MNKFLYIAFGVALVVFLAMGGFYLYSTGDLAILLGEIKPQNQVNSTTDWAGVREKISADCKDVAFTDLDSKNRYIGRLLDVLNGGVAYHADTKSFSFSNDTESILDPVDLASKANMPCLAVWVGKSDGSGNVAYETAGGALKKLPVTAFPVPPTIPESSSTPTATPTP